MIWSYDNQSDSLDLSRLRLKEIPDMLCNLTHLKKLDLSNNKLIYAEDLNVLKGLSSLNLIGNPRIVKNLQNKVPILGHFFDRNPNLYELGPIELVQLVSKTPRAVALTHSNIPGRMLARVPADGACFLSALQVGLEKSESKDRRSVTFQCSNTLVPKERDQSLIKRFKSLSSEQKLNFSKEITTEFTKMIQYNRDNRMEMKALCSLMGLMRRELLESTAMISALRRITEEGHVKFAESAFKRYTLGVKKIWNTGVGEMFCNMVTRYMAIASNQAIYIFIENPNSPTKVEVDYYNDDDGVLQMGLQCKYSYAIKCSPTDGPLYLSGGEVAMHLQCLQPNDIVLELSSDHHYSVHIPATDPRTALESNQITRSDATHDSITIRKDDEVFYNDQAFKAWVKELYDWADADDVKPIEQRRVAVDRILATYRNNYYSLELKDLNLSNMSALLFKGLPQLYTIDLSGNPLGVIPEDLLKYLPKVLSINLSQCELREIPHNLFEYQGNLSAIDLSHNKLTTLPADVFEYIYALKALDLSHNQISTLDKGIFDDQGVLRKLNLDHNSIVELAPDQFEMLKKVRTITLNDNRLEKVPGKLFQECYNLKHINLGFNKLNSIDRTLFHNNARLNSVALNDNMLLGLPEGAFINCPKLSKIELQNNNVSFLFNSLFKQSPELSEINIDNNPLSAFPEKVLELEGIEFLKI